MRAIYIAAAVALVVVAAGCAARRRRASKSGFLPAMRYRPLFIDPLGEGRNNSRGYTTGMMPSFDTEAEGSWMCGGMLGVPV